MSNVHVVTPTSSLGKMFGPTDPASDAAAAMAPGIPASDSGATAARANLATVDPLTKDNNSTKGKMFTWRNPIAGQSTFVQQDSAMQAPTTMGA